MVEIIRKEFANWFKLNLLNGNVREDVSKSDVGGFDRVTHNG